VSTARIDEIEARQRRRISFTLARLLPATKAPLGLAGVLALPIFFASLMAVSLAIEKPKTYAWRRANGKLIVRYHAPTASTEAKIWLLAFVAPLLLVLVGVVASRFRYGLYVVCVAAIVDALALTIRLGRWEQHHTARYPFGEDLYPDSSTSSLIDRGEWEHEAAGTVHSLVGYTIGLALAAAAIALFVAWRRRRRPSAPPPAGGAELQETGGAPTTSGA
jgi:hypothetical protein